MLPAVVSVPPAMAAKPCYGDCQPGVVRGGGGLRYDATVGVNDQITVSLANGLLVVTNPTGTINSATGDCTVVSPHEAHCPVGPAPIIRLRGLDGNDVIKNSTGFSSDQFGGPGNDQLIGGSGDDELTGDTGGDLLQGGGGADTVTYPGTVTQIGVRADLDGATGDDGSADDGPAGARDTIATDVENLRGSNYDDVLIGNAGPNVIDGAGGHDQIQGLGGNDQLTARGGGTLDAGAGTDHCTSDLRLAPEPVDTFAGCETTEIMRPF
jgi:Ca2+-binding RTX toxin-like protein